MIYRAQAIFIGKVPVSLLFPLSGVINFKQFRNIVDVFVMQTNDLFDVEKIVGDPKGEQISGGKF